MVLDAEKGGIKMSNCPRCQYPLVETKQETGVGTDVMQHCTNCNFFNMQHYGKGIKV